MGFSTAAKNEMLDGATVNLISLHTGDPGAAGANNEVAGGGYARQAAVFDAAANAERLLNADVEFAGTPSSAVTHFGFWDSVGPSFKGSVAATGDQAFNVSGEYLVKATTTKLTLA